MAVKTIDQLEPVNGNFNIHNLLTSTFEDLTYYTSLFGTLLSNDYIPISHPDNSAGYVTKKLPVALFVYWMHKLSENTISTHLSTALNLKTLAWKHKSDLGLGTLADKSYILSGDIRKNTNTTTTKKAIPLESIDSTWGDLRTKSKITAAEVNSSGLPLTAVITEYKTDPLKTGGLALSTLNDLNLRDLAYRTYSSLNLSSLASRRYVDLSWHLTALNDVVDEPDSFRPGAAPVVGKLPIGAVDGYTPFTLTIATANEYGGLKVGYQQEHDRQYPLMVQDIAGSTAPNLGRAYVEVPWTDKRFDIPYSSFKLLGGNNSLTLTFDVQRSFFYQDHQTSLTQTSSFTTTITPVINGNVVGNLTPSLLGNNVQGCFALFSSGSTSNSIKITPYTNAKIDTENGSSSKYFTEKGTWETITNASDSKDGLLNKTDYSLILNLRDNLPANKPDSTYYYRLPIASNGRLGGIELYSSAKNNVTSFEQYSGRTDLIHLPVKINTSNLAYVSIPLAAGSTQAMTDAVLTSIGESINTVLGQLYPVGAIYITTDSSCPLATLIPGSEWKQVNGRYILASGQLDGTYGTQDYFAATKAGVSTATAGLPTHTHNINVGCGSCSCATLSSVKNSHRAASKTVTSTGPSSSIYGASQTVRPPAFVVNVFMRTR